MRIIVGLILIFFTKNLRAQGPFDGYLKGNKKLDIAPSFSFSKSNRYFGAPNQQYDFPFSGQSVGFFAEGGLSKNVDLIATVNFVFSENLSGFQDAGLYVKGRVFRTKLSKKGDFLSVLAASGASFPVGNYEPTAVGALGKRALEVPAKLLVHYESRLHFFVTGALGRHFRLDKLDTDDIARAQIERPEYSPENPPQFSTFLIKAGFPARNYYVDAWFERQITRGGTDFVPQVFDLPQAHGVDFTQIGGTFYYSENGKIGYFLSGGKILSGRNISPVRRISLGIVWKLDFEKK